LTKQIKMKKLFRQLLFALALFQSIKTIAQDGSLDLSFNPGTGTNKLEVISTAIQSDGKIIIGGDFTSYNGTPKNFIARLNTDGSLDASFNASTGPNDVVMTIAIQSDGKIIIGGYFTNYNGTARNRVARLNTDGSLDASFNVGTGISNFGYVETTAIQADGKIIIGGYISTYNGCIARLNTDGSRDYSFIGTGANNLVITTAIQSDGKIIIGGGFTSYNGISRNQIARLNSDGSLDASFNVGTGAGPTNIHYVMATAIQKDGKVIIGGLFTTYNGTVINHIARLNTDGSLDTSFNVGTGADSEVEAIAIQKDGKIIIGGFFEYYNGTPKNFIARLNIDGSLDASFIIGTGANEQVESITLQKDGKIIIGGWFTDYNSISRNHIARLNVCTNLSSSVIIYSDTCFSDNTKFSISNIIAHDSLHWNFNDLNSNLLNNSTLINPVHKFTSSGSYNVSVSVYSCNSSNSISKQLFINPTPQINLGNDTLICPGDSLKLNTNLGYSQYLWSDNSTNNNILVKTSGKYWAKVTDNGCANSDTINISFAKSINLGRDTTFCVDSSYVLNPDNNSSSTYLWPDNSSASSLTIKNSGTYWVRASNIQCVSSDTINVVFDNNKNMLATASKDTVSYPEGIQFSASGNNILNYKWNFNDGSSSNIQNPFHVFEESGDYNVTVEATNTNNCTVTKNIPIVVLEILFIPNLFTPNKDNLNDDFKILYNGKEQYHLEIYNQWGEQIFTTKEKLNSWDGKNVSDGIYYYRLNIGTNIYKGWVQLLK
jgi:uncharacterized delta-60 repeat protein/gliding motility-associated-like protein